MKKILLLKFIFLFLFLTNSYSLNLNDLKKLGDNVKKELEKNIDINKDQKPKDNQKTQSKENKTEKKVTKQNDQNLFVDNKISEQEIVKLIYCKYDFTREVIQNYDRGSVKYNLGDKKNLTYYNFDTELEIDNCSKYEPKNRFHPNNGQPIFKFILNSSEEIDYKKYENYWLSSILNSRYLNVKGKLGSKVNISATINRQPTETTKVLSNSDLMSYCLKQNSVERMNTTSKYEKVIFMTSYSWDGYKIVASCNGKNDFKQFIPVSKGKFSLLDVSGYQPTKQLEEKDKLLAQEKDQREKERIEKEKKRIEYENSPEGLLHRSYVFSIILEKLYNSRTSYAIQYITSEQFSDIKKKVKFVEDQAISKHNINSDEIWKKATETYKRDYAFSIDTVESTGQYLDEGKKITNLAIMDIDYCYKELGGSEEIKKSF